MDLKDLLTKIDSIQEDGLDPANLAVREKWRFADKKAHLFSLLKQLRDLVNAKSIKESNNFEKDLVESFGYQLDEADGVLSRVGKKIAWPVTVASAIWDAYEQVVALPRTMPKEEFKKEVAKIIGKVVGEYGVFAVGAGIGAALGGASGPGALVTGIAGGFAAQWAFGDDVNKLVDHIVAQLYSEEGPSQEPLKTDPASLGNQGITSSVVKEVQTALQNAGFNVGASGADGIIGPNTITALQQYKKRVNAENDLEAIAKLMNISSTPVSEAEHIAELRSTLDQINEAPRLLARGLRFAKNLLTGMGGSLRRFARNNRFLSIIAGLTGGGYVWDKYGNLIQSKAHEIAPSLVPAPSEEPAVTTTEPSNISPGGGATTTPATVRPTTPGRIPPKLAVDPQLKKLVNDIKVDITDLKRLTSPEIIPDAKKAIDHAEKTLKLYAPGI